MNDRPFPDRPTGERMTEGQIEDVLSAIRRLVSDEALLAVRGRVPAIVTAAGPEGPEAAPVARHDAPPPKLILTAAQRVHAGAALPRAVEVIGAAVPAQGFESDTGDAAPTTAAWPAALWDTPPDPAPDPAPEPDAAPDADPAGAGLVAAPADGDPPQAPHSDAALRALIREILREELQGRIGERITTNVRKLVRAEINRLIALHDAQG